MEKEIVSGNYLKISDFATNGLSEVIVELRDDGENDVLCTIDNGVLYVRNNGTIVLVTNLFKVIYRDKMYKIKKYE